MERVTWLSWWMVALTFAPISARAQTEWVEIPPPRMDEGDRMTDCAVIRGELFVSRHRDILRVNDPRGVPSWRSVYEHTGADELSQFVVHPTAGAVVLGELSSIVWLDHRTWTLEHEAEGRPGMYSAFVGPDGRMYVVPSEGDTLRRGEDGTWAPQSRAEMRAVFAPWGPSPCGWSSSGDGIARAACMDEETGDLRHHAVTGGRWAPLDAPPPDHDWLIFDWASPTLVTTFFEDRPGETIWLRRAGRWDELPRTPTRVGNACQDGDTIYAMSGRRMYRARLPTD